MSSTRMTLRPLLLGAAAVIAAGSAGAMQAPPAVLVVDGLVVGQYVKGAWRKPPSASIGKGPLRLRGVGMGRAAGETTGRRLIESEGNGAILVDPERKGVYVSGLTPRYRTVSPAPGALARNRAAVLRLLRSRGVRGEPVARGSFRGDLDGDGRQDVLMWLGARAGMKLGRGAQKGDFSAILIFPMGTTPGAQSIAHLGVRTGDDGQSLWFAEPRAIADLDRDGTQEIVLSTGYDLGPGAMLLRYKGGRTRVLAEAMNDEP